MLKPLYRSSIVKSYIGRYIGLGLRVLPRERV